jgi:hypothetical protein
MPTKIKTPGIVTSDTRIMEDQWIFNWAGEPPREFPLHKVLFRPGTPADISANGWRIMARAVMELADSFHLVSGRTPQVAWLKLNQVYGRRCLLGVHQYETVVSALPLSSHAKPFIPYRYFDRMANNPEWKDLECACSYRHFYVNFHNGLTFYTDKFGWMCEMAYHLHFGVRGIATLWSSIRLCHQRNNMCHQRNNTNDRVIMVPHRCRVSETLADLPGKVHVLSQLGQVFIRKLGSAWLREHDRDERWQLASSLLSRIKVPAWRLNELHEDSELMSCHTKLEMLLFLAKIFQSNPTGHAADLLTLSRALLL